LAGLSTLCALMFYVLGIFMFLAACIIAVGWAGRGPRDESANGKKP
jgi:hypothetical protein